MKQRTPQAWIDTGIVSRETVERLELYAALLTRWNPSINLVSPRDLPNLWDRHIADSLQLAPLISADHATDLGSGGGFPGLVLAIATGCRMTLIESDQRKAAFLREAARVTGCEVTVLATRIEQAKVAPAPLITARALAALPQLLRWAAPLLTPGGTCLFLKGTRAEDELTQAAAEWQMSVTRIPSRVHPDGVILQLTDIRRATNQAQGPRS